MITAAMSAMPPGVFKAAFDIITLLASSDLGEAFLTTIDCSNVQLATEVDGKPT